ncbi:hypothetical protein DM02DRAFT_572927 [Periconia macrospinosa]|uniref:DUF1304-domain-containing protein n=1 Tax=Periconia macrospinosa TaxID=97972 RepID=A0A2V1D8H9_9PLEO|nr:hypothetical protein DM02DRAFT_572927 [Periconia macrospinosa]
MTSTQHPLLLASSAIHVLLAVGHTVKGREIFQHPSLSRLPSILKDTVRVGWYEGSMFFAMMSFLNYKWSQTGLVDGADKAIAGLLVTLFFGAGANYARAGDKGLGFAMSIIGVFQAVAARKGVL